MSINVDPESLKSLAEDVDLAILRVTSALRNEVDPAILRGTSALRNDNESLKKQIADLNKQIADLKSAVPVKQITAVFVNGSLPSGNSTYSHDLGATPSSAGASCSGTDGSGSTPDITVVGYTSTTVTVYCPSANNKNAVIILKR